MKRTVLIVSLVANIFLVLAVVFLTVRPSAVAPAPALPAISVAEAHPSPIAIPVAVRPGISNVADLVEQLRAAKVPGALLARMLAADFEDRWQQRQRDMQDRYNHGDIDEMELEQFNEQHDAEQEKDMRAALGDDAFRQWDQDNILRELNADKAKLTASEKDALYDLKKKLNQKQHDLMMQMQSGQIDATDCNNQQAAAQNDYEAQVKTMLGDDRYTAMQNTDDGSTGSLRRSLRAMNASDSQFSALLDAQRKWNEQRAALDQQYQDAKDQSQDYATQLQAIDTARDQLYQQVLGTNGVAMLQEQQDDRFQTMKHFSSAWQLSDSDINYLYHTLQYYDQTVQEYQRQAEAMQKQGQAVDWSGVQSNLKQFADQTMAGMQTYLGQDRFGKMKNNGVINLAVPEESASTQ